MKKLKTQKPLTDVCNDIMDLFHEDMEKFKAQKPSTDSFHDVMENKSKHRNI